MYVSTVLTQRNKQRSIQSWVDKMWLSNLDSFSWFNVCDHQRNDRLKDIGHVLLQQRWDWRKQTVAT